MIHWLFEFLGCESFGGSLRAVFEVPTYFSGFGLAEEGEGRFRMVRHLENEGPALRCFHWAREKRNYEIWEWGGSVRSCVPGLLIPLLRIARIVCI